MLCFHNQWIKKLKTYIIKTYLSRGERVFPFVLSLLVSKNNGEKQSNLYNQNKSHKSGLFDTWHYNFEIWLAVPVSLKFILGCTIVCNSENLG